MARKLSGITPRALAVAVITAAPFAAATSFAEERARPAASPAIVQNPFSATASQATATETEPGPPHRAAATYRNPFANRSTAPPIGPPLSGPISRWRPAAPPLIEPSPIKTAILSAEPIADIQIPWGQLPPTETMRDRSVSRNRSAGDAGFAEPPDPVRFAATPLAQPAWLVESAQPLKPLSPIGQATFDQPITGERAGARASRQPAARSDDDFSAIVVTDLDDSPQGWLTQAQEAASTAESLHELSAVAGLCQRGLAGSPSAELSTALRQLAAWAHNRRGELLAEADQPRDAMKDFQLAIALDANCSLAIHNRAVTLAEQNQLAAALRDFNRVIELNPGLGVAYRNRAELLAALGRMEEALPDYDRAIESLPDDAALYSARAYAWQRLGDYDRAGEDLNRALEIAPDHPEMLTQRGNLAADRRDYDHARGDFQQAIAIDPDCAEAHRSLAWLHATCADERYRDAERALSAARKAAELSAAGDYLVLDTLAAAHAGAGQFDEAVRNAEQAIAAAPPEFGKQLRQRLALYQAGQPFRSRAR